MSQFNEGAEPVICDAYAEPTHHWVLERGRPPVKAPGRREARSYCRPPGKSTGITQADEIGTRIPLDRVNEIRLREGRPSDSRRLARRGPGLPRRQPS